MALRIVEFFGYAAADMSVKARRAREQRLCPFLGSTCVKKLRNGEPSGVCAVRQTQDPRPIICCPNRLYGQRFRSLHEVAGEAFRGPIRLVHPDRIPSSTAKGRVVVFGKRWGKEIRIPSGADGKGGYYVDWLLVRLLPSGELSRFVAAEVQSIDTTGNYRRERAALLQGRAFRGSNEGGINWENVSKRILPQLIYKGHVLRHERLCKDGLFFVCPEPVYERVMARLGGGLRSYSTRDHGTVTFWRYDLGRKARPGQIGALKHCGTFTTTVDAIATAFSAGLGLPEAGVYERALKAELLRPD